MIVTQKVHKIIIIKELYFSIKLSAIYYIHNLLKIFLAFWEISIVYKKNNA